MSSRRVDPDYLSIEAGRYR